MVRDVGLAEELAQDALVAALEQWPRSGIPDNPGAWLMAAAKHRAIDAFRRNSLSEARHEGVAEERKGKGGGGTRGLAPPHWTIGSATICSASCSSPAIRSC